MWFGYHIGSGVIMNVQQRFDAASVKSDVMSSELPDGGSVLLNLDSELYFGLNEVGTLLWNALQAGESYESVIGRLHAQFDVPRETLDADVTALLDQLDGKGLLVTSGA